MPYDEGLAQRLREALVDCSNVQEKKMFGGLAFMVDGHMCCGIVREELMARVGPDAYEEALALPHARKMDFTGKPLRGFLYVGTEGFEEDEDLATWVRRCTDFVGSLPPK